MDCSIIFVIHIDPQIIDRIPTINPSNDPTTLPQNASLAELLAQPQSNL